MLFRMIKVCKKRPACYAGISNKKGALSFMDNRTFYYARVSTKDQNLDRQLTAFKALGASERDIITDKESGKDLDRRG